MWPWPPSGTDLSAYAADKPDDPPEYEKLEYDGTWLWFEREFDVRPTTWLLHNLYLQCMAVFIVLYLTMIYVGQRIMLHRPAFQLRTPLMLWNYALAAFSIFGSVRTSQELWFVYSRRGFVGATCTVSIAHSMAAFWAEQFTYSKVFELGDTLFLVLRKRPISFLHWYHHVTVLAYTWHAVGDHTVAGRWFIWMNYTVHAVMYSYYAVVSSGRWRAPRIVSASVTTLQITQMFVGIYIAYHVYRIKTAGSQFCLHSWTNIYGSMVMYGSYMILFLRYFYMAYIKTKPPPAKPEPRRYGRAVQNGKVHAD